MTEDNSSYINTEVGRIPKDWKLRSLGEIAAKLTTGKLDANAMHPNGDYPFFTCAREVYRIDKFAFDGDALLVSGNGANVGYVHHYVGKFNAYQRTYVLQSFDANSNYIKLQLESRLADRIRTEVNSGNTPYILRGTLSEMKIPVPSNTDEQQAIAKALGDVDGLIASLEALIAKKRDIKQGAMQELLSGHRRLPGFMGEWVVKPIGSLFKPLRSVALSRAQTGSTGDTGYVHYGDIHTKFHGHLDLNSEALPCVDAQQTRNATHLQEGDWVFADASEDYDGVAKAVEIVGTAIKPSVAGLHTLALRDVDNSFAPMFKGYLAAAGHFRKQVLRAATGMKVFGVSKTKMLEIELHHPENKNEQTAIAKTLHSMDAEITALEAKLLKTRDVKQGMMQVLLTGEVRLV